MFPSAAVFVFLSTLHLVASYRVIPDDPKLGDCLPLSCGPHLNITYPFWIYNKQPAYCGLPQFNLICDDDEVTLFLQTPRDAYQVNRIFFENQSILVQPQLLTNLTCPLYDDDLTFRLTPFTVSSANMELLLLYNCTNPPSPDYFKLPCGGRQIFSFLNTTYTIPEHFGVYEGCLVAQVPVLDFPGANGSDYFKLLKDGFLLEWNAPDCNDCTASGGECGYNSTRDTFMCICNDRTHSRSCSNSNNTTTKSDTGKIPKETKPKRKSHTTMIAIGVAVAVGAVLLTVCLACCIWYKCRRVMRQQSSSSKLLIRTGSSIKMAQEIGSTQVFSYDELHEATNGFDESRELGDGGFGTVYKGQLHDGRVVAVKRLYENNYKRVEQFLNEVDILSRLRHKNLVTLYGCTSRHSRELLLVYEFVPNGTVADHLHGPRAPGNGLTWPIRLNIAIETADSLAYLHAVEPQIIHRDVKTNNILLDNSFHVKVADFGLSRLFPVNATHVSTLPQGTPGYVDPEYHQCYQLTDKSDVYSFGVVLVELISSMPAVDISRHRHEINLANLAVNKIQNREIDQLIDPQLGHCEDWEIERMINMVAELAFRCLQADGDMRPSIKEVLEELKRIENKGEKGVEVAEIGDDARLLKNQVPYSPDTVTVRWESSATTPNTSA